MANYKAAVLRFLDSKGIKYQDEGAYRISVSYKCENIPSVKVAVVFDDDGDGLVALRSWSLGSVKDDKYARVLMLCNDLNDKYRWVKFYIDKDQDICAALDAVIDINTCGAEVHQLLTRMVGICDGAYSEIMKAMWQ